MSTPNVSAIDEENIKRFWASFVTWFEQELPGTEILQPIYEYYDNWNNGTWLLNIDYEKEYKLQYGISYPDVLGKENPPWFFIKLEECLQLYSNTENKNRKPVDKF